MLRSLQSKQKGFDRDRADAAAPLVGRLLCGKWRVEQLLGKGGMASVYAATHRNGKRVAIKVLNRDLTVSQRVRARFLREGYIANRVGHEGAVAVLDDDTTEDGIVFLVMELFEGETLQARCARLGGRLPLPEVAFAMDALLEVLVSAHTNGIVHRDIKPSNLFLTDRGQLKLLDFGIASLREISGAISQTNSASTLGTPGYMAPEQARGRWNEVDARTDLWALGATMFRLLSGRLVHEAETANEAVILAATEPAPSLAASGLDLPDLAVELVDRALLQDPHARWQNARTMRAALQQLRSAMAPYVWQPVPRQLAEFVTSPDDQTASSKVQVFTSERASPSAGPLSHERRSRLPVKGPQLWLLVFGVLLVAFGVAALARRNAAPEVGLPATASVPHEVRAQASEAPVATRVAAPVPEAPPSPRESTPVATSPSPTLRRRLPLRPLSPELPATTQPAGSAQVPEKKLEAKPEPAPDLLDIRR